MSKIIETTVFEFSELSDQAKEKAREWYREHALDYEWWESTYEDAEQVGLKIKSFDLDRNRHATGNFISGAVECAELILKNHGQDCETFKTARAFNVSHIDLEKQIENCDGDDETNCEYELWQDKREELNADFLKSILEDYSIMLQKEMEWLMSDEQCDESIITNGYTFTESGARF